VTHSDVFTMTSVIFFSIELGKDEEKDNDEENDGFFVPHGYLSSDEEQNDNGKFQSLLHFIFRPSTLNRLKMRSVCIRTL